MIPLVLIPGFMLDHGMWSDVAHDLAALGPLSYADPCHATSIEDMAAQTLATAPERFVAIGFSMGGYVAREMQRQAPERIMALVLAATSARGDTELEFQRKAGMAHADPSLFAGLSRTSIRRSLAPSSQGDGDLIERIHAMSVRLGGNLLRRQLLFRRSGDVASLHQISCPTLIVAGLQDRLRSLEEAEELAQHIPGATIASVDTGHMVPLEAPATFARLVADFIASSSLDAPIRR